MSMPQIKPLRTLTLIRTLYEESTAHGTNPHKIIQLYQIRLTFNKPLFKTT